MRRKLVLGLVIVTVSLTLALYLVLEIVFAVPPPFAWYLPGLLVVAGAAGLGAWFGREKAPLVIGGIAVALLLLSFLIPWTPRKRFLAHLDDVTAGMSRGEVRRAMLPYLAVREDVEMRMYDTDDGEVPSRVDLYRHSRSSRFDADVAVIVYDGERVDRTRFYPD